ncbi:NlpC/P60 family protein [Spirulina major CS-329]|uniref:C40 family peptidase n=1 Tax=Spirulina TaxID=1154 RepID=UPI00232F13D6|nr:MULTISPECIES: C40 family peptidase [Spirulina]MDB9494791.1 NlpC/P60 family protein [Spirulina subsalsa CS-330]MDB9504390.1 NlpC/P60 family protein [Spirulina major CS-329]
MPTSPHFAPSPSGEYRCGENLNLYTSSACTGLATQAAAGRQLRIIGTAENAVQVQLCEDDYLAWLDLSDRTLIAPAPEPYQAVRVERDDIERRIEGAIAFARAAMAQPHHYLWGGTVAPNYDCSGLMQAAFASVGVWLPRDSYQQGAFTTAIAFEELQAGDLLFFQEPEKSRISHVALYLGDGDYLHSSGVQRGRNGIGIDPFTANGSEIGARYYPLRHSAGRILHSYQPGDGWAG